METAKNERLNELAKDFRDIEARRTMMKEFGNSDTAFAGTNEDGETVLLSVAPDSIVVETFQNNGWTRKDYYDTDGHNEGESYDGRWK